MTSPVPGFLEATVRFVVADAGFTTAGGRPGTEGEAVHGSPGARHQDDAFRRRRCILFTDRTLLVAQHVCASSDGVQHVPIRVPAIPATPAGIDDVTPRNMFRHPVVGGVA
jgi:hypothetical protein